ncbi:TlpA family protein disulfide reductase [Psychroserpens sp. Hel_I_66]|uniref:TlpA family protein disulfide reductase n=1 Tax=Psychroserpens sp. Hel_I_66 TaxID=1250004 RepID=UPI000A7DD09F|nr:TlpA disulfide reductase family protein [Psychroserpens sp. Hel_I_66]
MRNLFAILLLTIVLVSCQKKETSKLTSITLEASVDSLDSPIFFRPINGIDVWDKNMDSLELIKDSIYYGEFNVKAPEYVRFILDKKRFKMFLLPNQNYKITLKDGGILFFGDNAKGQQLYNEFKRTPTGSFSFLNDFDKDTTVVSVKNHVSDLKDKEISQIDKLLKQKEIDEEFYQLLNTDIDYYYANAIVSLADYRRGQVSKEYKQSFENLMDSISKTYSYSVKHKPQNWTDYVMESKIYPEIQSQYSQEQRQEFYAKDSLHPIYMNIIQNLIEEPFREDLLANYILNSSKQTNYEQSLVSVFNEFKTDYPNSEFIQYLENDIDLIRAYQEKVKSDLPSSVTFVEGENINSLEDLLKEFKGQKLYIDVWATWCGPCKKEFSNNHMIADILYEKGYKKLFISLDRKEEKDKWVELIKYYDLSGYHHLANQEFYKDFEKEHSRIQNGITIPQYLIVDENGSVVTNDAPRPGAPGEVLKLLR